MKICVTQRDGIRYFSRFADLSERDRLIIEVTIEDKNTKPVIIDMTEALMEEYSRNPILGKISRRASDEMPDPVPAKKTVTRKSKTVIPAYVTESKRQKEEMLAKVKEAQLKLAEERKQKQAEIAAARAERMAIARKAKAEKEALLLKPVVSKKTKPAVQETAKLTKAQKAAIDKISKTLNSEDKIKATNAPKAKKAAPKAAESKQTAPKTKPEKLVTPAASRKTAVKAAAKPVATKAAKAIQSPPPAVRKRVPAASGKVKAGRA